MRRLDWFEGLEGAQYEELWDKMNGLQISGVDEDTHKLFGHTNEVLVESELPIGSGTIKDCCLVWRIDADLQAGTVANG